jgi:type IV secretory pathway VirB4 component
MLTMSSQPHGRVRLRLSSFPRHIHITGTTGSGKSTTARVICAGLHENHVPTVVLDRTGEYAEAFAESDAIILRPGENLSIALFELKEGEDTEAQIVGWLSLMNHFYLVCYGHELSPLQGRVMRKALSDSYRGSKKTVTITDLIYELEAILKENEGRGGWPEAIEAAISRLWPLTISKVGATFNRSYSTFEVAQLFEPNMTIVDLSVLPNDNARNLLSQVVLKHVYEEARKKAKPNHDAISLAFLIDEAHHVCPNRRDYISIPERCAIELRKYGFSLITCATRPNSSQP